MTVGNSCVSPLVDYDHVLVGENSSIHARKLTDMKPSYSITASDCGNIDASVVSRRFTHYARIPIHASQTRIGRRSRFV